MQGGCVVKGRSNDQVGKCFSNLRLRDADLKTSFPLEHCLLIENGG